MELLGLGDREIGQSRVPVPPDMMTGVIRVIVGFRPGVTTLP
jgi:hypothetical protein